MTVKTCGMNHTCSRNASTVSFRKSLPTKGSERWRAENRSSASKGPEVGIATFRNFKAKVLVSPTLKSRMVIRLQKRRNLRSIEETLLRVVIAFTSPSVLATGVAWKRTVPGFKLAETFDIVLLNFVTINVAIWWLDNFAPSTSDETAGGDELVLTLAMDLPMHSCIDDFGTCYRCFFGYSQGIFPNS
ncbi:hypothetical protein Tco_0578936 [Tanacetum coccineum]